MSGLAQSRGTLNLRQDSRIDRLMQKQREVYAASNTMNTTANNSRTIKLCNE